MPTNVYTEVLIDGMICSNNSSSDYNNSCHTVGIFETVIKLPNISTTCFKQNTKYT